MKYIKIICLVWIIGLVGGNISGAITPAQVREATGFVIHKWMDISYADQSPNETLDLYLPNEGDGPFPVIIYVHSGAFEWGDAYEVIENNLIEPTLQAGYALASMNYRLSGEAIFPAAIEDVKAAIRFIRAHAEEYHLDPDLIALWGSGAGGNLVALAGVTDDSQIFNDSVLGNVGVSSKVRAVIDWYGPINFLTMDSQFKSSALMGTSHQVAKSPESKYLGACITQVPQRVKKANPETYLSSTNPPFLIEVGRRDLIIPYQQSVIFAKKLGQVIEKDQVRLVVIPDAGHGGVAFTHLENLKIVYHFLDRFMK